MLNNLVVVIRLIDLLMLLEVMVIITDFLIVLLSKLTIIIAINRFVIIVNFRNLFDKALTKKKLVSHGLSCNP